MHALRLAFAAIAGFAATCVGVCSPATALGADSLAQPSGVLWLATHEGGDLSEWSLGEGGGLFSTGNGRAMVSTDVAHSGRYSVAMTIAASDGQRQAVRLFRWAESRQASEAYYSAWYYFPENYWPGSWWNVFQWKSKLSEADNDPLWILNVGHRPTGEMYFYLYDWINERSYDQSVMDIPLGRWFHIEAFYKQAADNTGQVTFWQDGVRILDVTGVQTRRSGDQIQWSLNNYTDAISPATATIYVDDAAIGTTPQTDGASVALVADIPEKPRFVLGFALLADLLQGRTGDPLENERLDAGSGDTLQRTTRGLMVWRRADNLVAFTDGTTTWVNGPYGLQDRPNDARFPWETATSP